MFLSVPFPLDFWDHYFFGTPLQSVIREKFEQAGLEGIVTFLEPESFHMTICDIDASPDPIRLQKLDDRIEQVGSAFQQIGTPSKVTAHIQGIGLKSTITALVRFDEAGQSELDKVLRMERKIKAETRINPREFTGHISLAYFVRYPGSAINEMKRILLACEKEVLWKFTFSQFDLTYFTDMNEYIPLLTINLEDGQVKRHDSNIQMLKTVLLLLRATTLLHKHPLSDLCWCFQFDT